MFSPYPPLVVTRPYAATLREQALSKLAQRHIDLVHNSSTAVASSAHATDFDYQVVSASIILTSLFRLRQYFDRAKHVHRIGILFISVGKISRHEMTIHPLVLLQFSPQLQSLPQSACSQTRSCRGDERFGRNPRDEICAEKPKKSDADGRKLKTDRSGGGTSSRGLCWPTVRSLRGTTDKRKVVSICIPF